MRKIFNGIQIIILLFILSILFIFDNPQNKSAYAAYPSCVQKCQSLGYTGGWCPSSGLQCSNTLCGGGPVDTRYCVARAPQITLPAGTQLSGCTPDQCTCYTCTNTYCDMYQGQPLGCNLFNCKCYVWLDISTIDPEGKPVNVKGLAGVGLNSTWGQITDNSFLHVNMGAGGADNGGGISLYSNQLINGITANPGGGYTFDRDLSASFCWTGYWYNCDIVHSYLWNPYQSTGVASLTYTIVTMTPTPTCAPPPGNVTGLTPSGTVINGNYSFGFNPATGADNYYMYVDDIDSPADLWSGDCANPFPGDFCGWVTPNSHQQQLEVGHTYGWGVLPHTDSCNQFGNWATESVSVVAPSATPTPYIDVHIRSPLNDRLTRTVCSSTWVPNLYQNEEHNNCQSNASGDYKSDLYSVRNWGSKGAFIQKTADDVLIGITPAPGDGSYGDNGNANPLLAGWITLNWHTGGRSVNVYLASPTPTPTPYVTITFQNPVGGPLSRTVCRSSWGGGFAGEAHDNCSVNPVSSYNSSLYKPDKGNSGIFMTKLPAELLAGITPAIPVGGVQDNAGSIIAGWATWNTGGKSMNIVLMSPTPTPTFYSLSGWVYTEENNAINRWEEGNENPLPNYQIHITGTDSIRGNLDLTQTTQNASLSGILGNYIFTPLYNGIFYMDINVTPTSSVLYPGYTINKKIISDGTGDLEAYYPWITITSTPAVGEPSVTHVPPNFESPTPTPTDHATPTDLPTPTGIIITPTVTVTIPPAPINLSATAVSTSQINLSWTDTSSSETGFEIERAQDVSGSPGTYIQIFITGPDATSYQNNGLAPDTTYWYRVRATSNIGDSPYSNEASATTKISPQPPNPPSNLDANAVSESQINLTWTDNSNNESGFKIERAPDASGSPGSWTQISTTGADRTSYSDKGLSPDTTYWYRIRATNNSGDSAYSNTDSARTLPLTSTPTPSITPFAPTAPLPTPVLTSPPHEYVTNERPTFSAYVENPNGNNVWAHFYSHWVPSDYFDANGSYLSPSGGYSVWNPDSSYMTTSGAYWWTAYAQSSSGQKSADAKPWIVYLDYTSPPKPAPPDCVLQSQSLVTGNCTFLCSWTSNNENDGSKSDTYWYRPIFWTIDKNNISFGWNPGWLDKPKGLNITVITTDGTNLFSQMVDADNARPDGGVGNQSAFSNIAGPTPCDEVIYPSPPIHDTPTDTPKVTPTPTITPSPVTGPWTQVKGGDVYMPSIIETIPAGGIFLDVIPGVQFSTGVVRTETGTINPGAGKLTPLSPNHWIYTEPLSNTYNFNYYWDNLGSKAVQDTTNSVIVIPKNTPDAIYSFGNLEAPTGSGNVFTLDNTTFYDPVNHYTGRKPGSSDTTIILISGGLNITNDIIFADAGDTLIFIVNGPIVVDSAVKHLSGMFISSDRTTINPGTDQFTLDGMLNTKELRLLRVPADVTIPTYIFIYEPKYLLDLVSFMGRSQINWQEVAP